jgi:acyl-CoA thioester hydrolase
MRTRIQVRWRDRDALGHVTAAVFPTYFEESRNAWLEEHLGSDFGPEQYVVARLEIDYRAEIAPGVGEVWGEHTVHSVGRSSVTFDERLFDPGDRLLAEARFVIVFWRPEERGSRPMTEEERRILEEAREHTSVG